MSPVSAFILSFNHTQKLIDCVQSLCAQSCITEILILDNQSRVDMTETYALIRELATPEVSIEIQFSEYGMSFSEAQNWGLDRCQNDFVLLMNNDAAILGTDTLQSSVVLLESYPTVGLVGHKILNLDGTVNHHGVYMNLGNWTPTHFGHHRRASDFRFSRLYSCIAVTAACVLVRRTSIRFDPVYWFCYEDVDFCFQYTQAGYRILCNPECVVSHEESSSRKLVQHVDPLWLGKQTISFQYFKQKWASYRWVLLLKSLPMNFLSSVSNSEFLFRTHADYLAALGVFGLVVYFYHLSWGSFLYGGAVFLAWAAVYFLIRYGLFFVLEWMTLFFVWIGSLS